jgi:hypothetical protein
MRLLSLVDNSSFPVTFFKLRDPLYCVHLSGAHTRLVETPTLVVRNLVVCLKNEKNWTDLVVHFFI